MTSTSGKRSEMLLKPHNTQESLQSRELFSPNISSSTVEKPCSSHTNPLSITQDHQASSYLRAFALAIRLDPQTHYICVYMCVYTYVCIHTCIYAYVCTHAYMCVYMYVCTHVHICKCLYMHTCVYTHMHMHAYVYNVFI